MNTKQWMGLILAGVAGTALGWGWRQGHFRFEDNPVPLAGMAADCCPVDDMKDDGDAHTHGGHGGDLAMSVEEILAAHCEHEVLAHICSQCRYEVGVAALDAALQGSSENEALIAVETLSHRVLTPVSTVTGDVRFNELRTVRVSPPVTGILHTLWVQPGDTISRDQVLFEVESAELSQMLGEYVRNQTLAELARRNYQREKELHEKGISAEKEMLDARMEYEQYQTGMQAVRQQLAAVGLDEALVRAAGHEAPNAPFRIPVRASQDGVVVTMQGSAGQNVRPDETVLTISDLDSVWVLADLYERDFSRVLVRDLRGLEVTVCTGSYPEREFKGTVTYVGDTMSETTRTVKLRIEMDNRERILRPGMFCTVELPDGPEIEVLAAPRDAVLQDDGTTFLFVNLKDQYYVRRAVETGRSFGGWTEILAGATPGQTIVTQGAFLLKSDVLREKMGAGCAD